MKHYKDQDYKAAYRRFEAAKTSGHCEECNWRDGDGVTTCFYSDLLGAVTHEDSPAAVAARMTESQRSLMVSYDSSLLVYWDEESERLRLRSDAARHGEGDEAGYIERQMRKPVACGRSGDTRYVSQAPEHTSLNAWWIPAHLVERVFWPSRFRAAGTLVEYMDRGNLYQYATDQDYISFMVHIYKPHSCGKGRGKFVSAYHIGCTGCAEEVKLWEFGVDPDCG